MLFPTLLIIFQGSGLPVPNALASTTDSTRLVQDPQVHEESLLRRSEDDGQARVWWPQSAWRAILEDDDGDGVQDSAPGIDALTHLVLAPSPILSLPDVVFSFNRDGFGGHCHATHGAHSMS